MIPVDTDDPCFLTIGLTVPGFADDTVAGAAGRVAPAALAYTLMEGLLCQYAIQGTGLALLEVSKKILGPTVVGDTIHVEVEALCDLQHGRA